MLGLWLAIAITTSAEMAEVEITAERQLHDGKRKLETAEGNASLVTDGMAIDAERIVYDRTQNVATAVGHVVARITQGGKIAVIADVVTVRLDEFNQVREVFINDGQAISKKDISGAALLGAKTAEAVERLGNTQALMAGNHLVRDGSQWTVDEMELVPCECDFKNPSWSISSSSATIDTEAERVAVTGALIRIKQVPILWLPWLSLPLSQRKSGLLFTQPVYNFQNGLVLNQPYYLTLGRSADLTVTPGFITGSTGSGGALGTLTGPSPIGVQGPRLSTEFRYMPSSRTTGKALIGLLYDFRTRRDVDAPTLRQEGTQRGLRGEFSWQHTQDFDAGFGTRVDLNAHSDGDYNRDLIVDVIASSATYLRSTASVFHRGDDHYLGLDVGLRQDIQWGYDLLGRQSDEARTVAKFGPGTLQRLPALTFGWAPTKRLGPLRFELEAEAVRLAPLFSATGDEGIEAEGGAILPEAFSVGVARLFIPSPTSLSSRGIGDRVWQPGEREARDRLMVMPRLSIAGQPVTGWSTSAFAAWRQLGWVGEVSGGSWSRGYLVLGGRLETEVSKTFAQGKVRHVIQPLVEVRAIPAGLSGAAPVAYDAIDAAVPDVTPRFQTIVELRQRLTLRDGTELLRLDLGQGAELNGPDYSKLKATLSESYGRVGTRIGWFSAQGLLSLDPLRHRVASDGLTPVAAGGVTRVGTRVELSDGQHGAYVGYENLLMEGTARSRKPLDLLFLIDRGFTSATRVRQLVLGAQWNFGSVGLRYDALVADQTIKNEPVLKLTQQTAAIGFSPACDCWRADFSAIFPMYPKVLFPNFGFNITVSRFGSIGTR